MIAVDTSSLRRALDRIHDRNATMTRTAIIEGIVILPPIVVAEALSDPGLPPEHRARILLMPILPIDEGYWERAGDLRAWLLRERLHAALPDTLVAQSCIDHDIPLITYDRDFRHFQRAGLMLV